jgi:fumarylacetoacetase
MRSFIDVNRNSDFPLQNIPFGVYRSHSGEPHICSAIGDYILDLKILEEENLFNNLSFKNKKVFSKNVLNDFMSLGKEARTEVRKKIQELLSEDNPELRDNSSLKQKVFIPMTEVKMLMPVEIGDYTDFYSSKEHATNVGIMFRGKENALMPNWLHLPVAYHGRASSVIVSGENIHRPKGQTKADDIENPEFGPSKLLDFELEMGFFVSKGNELGKPVPVENAEDHIFGMVIVNDWSARDIQKWEYVPLGPFLAKNFATSISPWIITPEALEPFRTDNPVQESEPLPYLQSKGKKTYDIKLEVSLTCDGLDEPHILTESNFKYLYWNMCQQIAHHTVTGCNLRTGDLLASGTISGAEKSSFGSMLELTWKGTEPINLANGEERKFLKDGDIITMKAWCEGNDYRIGFGEVSTKILPAIE